MDAFSLNLVSVIFLLALGVHVVLQGRRRSATQVLVDLSESYVAKNESVHTEKEKRSPAKALTQARMSEVAGVGIFQSSEQKRYLLRRKLTPLVWAFVALLLLLVSGKASSASIVLVGLGGLTLGFLFARYRHNTRKVDYLRKLEFFLPIVMERLVMAVQAGLDILPAVNAVLELEGLTGDKADQPKAKKNADPVSKLLRRVHELAESGLTFEQSLHDVAQSVESAPLRHAFIHLALAQREGGELIMPLRELSDSTQAYYQESVEEEIAKMPVRATAPLLLTFAGLIICFLTSPIVQIIEMTSKAIPK